MTPQRKDIPTSGLQIIDVVAGPGGVYSSPSHDTEAAVLDAQQRQAQQDEIKRQKQRLAEDICRDRAGAMMDITETLQQEWKRLNDQEQVPFDQYVGQQLGRRYDKRWFKHRGMGDHGKTVSAILQLHTAWSQIDTDGKSTPQATERLAADPPRFADIVFGNVTEPEVIEVQPTSSQARENHISWGENATDTSLPVSIEHFRTQMTAMLDRKTNIGCAQYESGSVIRQVAVDNRYTCVIACLQMLYMHSGILRHDFDGDLVRQKGEIMDLIQKLGSGDPEEWGTVSFQGVSGLIPELSNMFVQQGMSDTNPGSLTIERGGYLRDDMVNGQDTSIMPHAFLLLRVAQGYLRGENAIWSFNRGDNVMEENVPTGGHQIVCNGFAAVEEEGETQFYFHIIDPMGSSRWEEFSHLMPRISSVAYRSESRNHPLPQFSVTRDDLQRNPTPSTSSRSGKVIKWG